MTIEKFVRRSQLIEQLLSEIARRGGQEELEPALKSVNPHFQAVLGAQERLLNAVERLLEKLPERTAG